MNSLLEQKGLWILTYSLPVVPSALPMRPHTSSKPPPKTDMYIVVGVTQMRTKRSRATSSPSRFDLKSKTTMPELVRQRNSKS